MFFLNNSLKYNISSQIQIKYTQEKDLYIFCNNTKKIEIIKNLKKNNFQVFLNSKILIIHANDQCFNFLKIKFKQLLLKVLKKPYKKILFLKGTGFHAKVENSFLKLELGFSHEVHIIIPEYIKIHIIKSKKILCSSLFKNELSQFIATIRLSKKPDVYKNKGFLFLNENVLQKEGKKNKK